MENNTIITSDESKKAYCDTALELEKGARIVYLMLGERLYNIREKKLYEPFWDSWTEYCMEFKDLSTSAISKIVSIYEVFVLQYGFTAEELSEAGGWTKVYDIMKKVHSKKDAKDWLDKAKTLSRSDLTKEIKEVETGIEMHSCKHLNTYTIEVCEDCGEKIKVYDK